MSVFARFDHQVAPRLNVSLFDCRFTDNSADGSQASHTLLHQIIPVLFLIQFRYTGNVTELVEPTGRESEDVNAQQSPRSEPTGMESEDVNTQQRPRSEPTGRESEDVNAQQGSRLEPTGRESEDVNTQQGPRSEPTGRESRGCEYPAGSKVRANW